jgi:hypothetical protein
MDLTPPYAGPLIAARRAGKRPELLVVVSDGVPGLHRLLPSNVVIPVPRDSNPFHFDWSFLAGLEVEVATRYTDRHMVDLVDALDRAQPAYLRVWHEPSNRMMRVRYYGRRMLAPVMPAIENDEHDGVNHATH